MNNSIHLCLSTFCDYFPALAYRTEIIGTPIEMPRALANTFYDVVTHSVVLVNYFTC